MKKRSSRSTYYDEHMPLLARYYIDIHKDIFGCKVFVHEKYYSKFRVMEDDLREIGATPLEYADIVIRMLKNWANVKGLNSVPIRVFCGDWALGKFKKVFESDIVDISKDADTVLYSELLVARTYIEGNYSNIGNVVEDLRPLLDDDWIELYNEGSYRFSMGDALDILCEEYGVSYAIDYDDLRGKIDI